MIVIDTSAIVDLLLIRPANAELSSRMRSAGEFHAPHLLDVEFVSVLRRLTGQGRLSIDAASVALQAFDELSIERYTHVPLRRRIWALRHVLTAYDAAYVALSEALALPLVTSDARLARSTGHAAVIESFSR